VNFYSSSQASQGPGTLLSTLEGFLALLQTGQVATTQLDEGLCLLEGYYTPFSTATLKSLYPTHADYVAKYKAAAASDLADGFLTLADYDASVAAAQASSIP
jgi:hypothetical protein